jgi:hypothetical protein
MGSDDAFDTIILMAVLMIFTPIMIFLSIPFFNPHFGGFDTYVDKTALRTESEVIPIKRIFTTDDVILSLVVADRYTPLPKSIEINLGSGVADIPIDNSFLADRTASLQAAATAMPATIAVNMELFVGASGQRFWQVHN